MEDQIEYLHSCGFSYEEIAGQLGIPLSYVLDALMALGLT